MSKMTRRKNYLPTLLLYLDCQITHKTLIGRINKHEGVKKSTRP